MTNEYYSYDKDHNDSLRRAAFFDGLGGGASKYVDSQLMSRWVANIPQLINSPSYNPALGALLNRSNMFVTNQKYTQSVLVKDIASGFAGPTTETVLKESYNKVTTK